MLKRFLAFSILLIMTACTTPVISTNVDLDNTTKGWGLKRAQPRPEFTQGQIDEMNTYGCFYMGSDEEKNLYLTFDEGYENGYTGKILDVLKEKQVPAAFFVTGPYLKSEEELIKRMIDEGHTVGNHSINHPSLPDLGREEIEEELYGLDLMFYENYGRHMQYLRPPRGEYSTKILDITSDMGYTNVFWSLAYVDWQTDNQKGKEYALNSVIPNLHNGAVILLHAVSADNAAAMGDIIDKAREAGYVFKSLDEYR